MFVDRNKKLFFSEGSVFYDTTQVYLCPMNYFLSLINICSENLSQEEFKDIIKKSSKSEMEILYDELSCENDDFKKLINLFLLRINSFGFGELNLKLSRENTYIFKIDKPNLHLFYSQIFKKGLGFYIEEIFSGFLENFLSCVFKKNVECEISKVSFSLVFNVKVKDEDYVLSNEKFNPVRQIGDFSLVVKKLVMTGGLVFSEGMFKVSDSNGVLLPYFFMLDLLEKMSSFDFFEKSFNSLGKMQGKASVDFHNNFGANLGDETYNFVYSLSDISGIGRFTYTDPKVLTVKNNLNLFYSKFYTDKVINLFKGHIYNMSLGIYSFSYNEFSNFDEVSLDTIEFKKIGDNLELSDLEKNISKYLTTKILVSNFS